MNLSYSIAQLQEIFQAKTSGNTNHIVTKVEIDTRKLLHAESTLFFALEGENRSGYQFIPEAYQKGVRSFVISKKQDVPNFEEACFFIVDSPLKALQDLATFHRKRFSYPIVAITGSIGKTTWKEWAFWCLSDKFKVIRSPKSYNSQIGVALSLLELREGASIGLIEAGISKRGEMENLEKMIQPDFGIFTALGKAHSVNFINKEEHLTEKWRLFSHCKLAFIPESFSHINASLPTNFQLCKANYNHQYPSGYSEMIGVLQHFLAYLQIPSEEISYKLAHLPRLALRMEVFEGIQGNTIINDTYNLDLDALNEALIYQQKIAENKKRIVVIGLSDEAHTGKEEIDTLIQQYNPNQVLYLKQGETIPWENFNSSVILIKANRSLRLEHEVARGKAIKHRTVLEINLSAIKHNLQFYRSKLPRETRILAMVKAGAYGAGSLQIARFLELQGIQDFGVAFADEGVELRQGGISSRILVLNPDPEHSEWLIENKLTPAIYSFEQLDEFITTLIHKQITNYPIHLKFDTGMHRLGFSNQEKEQLLAVINAQPEVCVDGIYSHLADSDNPLSSDFTQKQLDNFNEIIHFFRNNLSVPFTAHILNSEGSLRYSSHAYDMVRIGISMYGYTENEALKGHFEPSVRWYSAVSQVKTIPAGDCVGYGCSFKANKLTQIAIVPVGYADGFKRNLSNGNGAVYIRGYRCEVIGKVCMDMIMVNVTNLGVQPNDKVEIIGINQPMEQLAAAMQTIPYEVMTGLSNRMHRLYINE